MTAIHPRESSRAASSERRSGFQIAANGAQRYERAVGAFMLCLSADLVERARLRRDDRVVDLACGTGFVARLAAERVRDRRNVVGVDINPAMVDEARRVTGLRVVEASADDTSLPGASFDVAMCQQGLQYVPDPAGALREIRRLLRPGGRSVVSVWSDFQHNPFRVAQLEAMAPHLPAESIEAFRLTSVAALGGLEGFARIFDAAGFEGVVVENVGRDIELPPIADYYPVLVSATPWAATFEALSPRQQCAVVDRLAQAAPASRSGCRVRMTVSVATASRPVV
jgi:ubiquinone/menaquinone biosynthesis C-methylase UbiE